MKTIAIIRLSSLGDIVHTLPAFQLLRRRFPEARISWIVEAPGARLLENFSGIDEIVVFNLRSQKGILGKACYVFRFLNRCRRRFDRVIDFQGLLKSAVLAFLLGGTRLGFCAKNARESLATLFYSQRAGYFPETRHVIYKNIHLLSLLGITGESLEYPLKKTAATPRLQEFLAGIHWPSKRYLVLNVGGGWPTKILPVGQWIQIANGLKLDHPLVLLWGNDQEKRMAEAVVRECDAAVAPFMDFADLIHLIGQAVLLISGDTLALHLADMTRTPAVAIFGPSSPQRNGPLLPSSRVIFQELECSYCYRRECDRMTCLKEIKVEDVIAAARKIDESLDGKID